MPVILIREIACRIFRGLNAINKLGSRRNSPLTGNESGMGIAGERNVLIFPSTAPLRPGDIAATDVCRMFASNYYFIIAIHLQPRNRNRKEAEEKLNGKRRADGREEEK